MVILYQTPLLIAQTRIRIPKVIRVLAYQLIAHPCLLQQRRTIIFISPLFSRLFPDLVRVPYRSPTESQALVKET